MPIERFELDTEQWAVVPRVPTVSNEMKARFIGEFSWKEETFYYDEDGIEHECEMVRTVPWDLCKRIYKEMAAHWIAAAPRPEAGQQTDQWTPSVSNYDRSIHSNPDAKAWADLFVQTFPGLADKHDLMLGWFANAMMAMHDHMARRAAPRPVPTPIPTSERLPTEEDADYFGNVWARLAVADRYDLHPLRSVMSCPEAFDYWQPTGLTRPAEPDGGAV